MTRFSLFRMCPSLASTSSFFIGTSDKSGLRIAAEALWPHVAGQLRCQACGRALPDHGALGQHVKDAHGGRNSPSPVAVAQQPQEAAGSGAVAAARCKPTGATSLADLLDAALRKRDAAGQAAEARQQQRRERPAPRQAPTHKKGIQGTIRVLPLDRHLGSKRIHHTLCSRLPASSAPSCRSDLPCGLWRRATTPFAGLIKISGSPPLHCTTDAAIASKCAETWRHGPVQVVGTGRVSDEAIVAGEVRPRALRKRQSRMKRLIVRQKAVRALAAAADAAAAADTGLVAAQATYDDLLQRLRVRLCSPLLR